MYQNLQDIIQEVKKEATGWENMFLSFVSKM